MSYVESNYYLKLLKNQIRTLKDVIERMDSDTKISEVAYNSILSGLIIKINVIIEQTLADYHSQEFSGFVNSVYNLRQIIVHYHDYKNIEGIKEASLAIVNEFNKVYKSEKDFFAKLLSFDDTKQQNFVIKNSKNIYYDESIKSYVIRGKNNDD